jgi:hypothetical protein
MRYLRRYTSDLFVIASSNTLADLTRQSDYVVHVWDTQAGIVAWQNVRSERYGNIAVCGMNTHDYLVDVQHRSGTWNTYRVPADRLTATCDGFKQSIDWEVRGWRAIPVEKVTDHERL